MPDDTQHAKTVDEVLQDERRALGLGQRMPIGLALSGGGIRSATFSLGVLQAFARRSKLGVFDYLSTVSGGGYVGGWLSAWICRAGSGGLDVVQAGLAREGVSRARADSGAARTGSTTRTSPASDEAPQVAWLRRYSNYLAPRPGLLTMDSLTLATTWVRNVVLNLIVVCAFLATLFTLPFVLLRDAILGVPLAAAAGHAAAWFGALFCGLIAYNLSQPQIARRMGDRWLISTTGVVSTVVVAAVLCAVCGSFWLFHGSDAASTAGWYLAGLLIAFLAGWSVVVALRLWNERAGRRQRFRHPVLAAIGIGALEIGWYAIGATVAIGGGLWVADFAVGHLLRWVTTLARADRAFATALLSLTAGPPIVLASIWVASTLFAGVVGRNYMERSREWWSRLNAWLLAAALWWTAWAALSFFALPLLLWIRAETEGWFALIGWGWIGSLLAAVFVRQPAAASERIRIRFDRALNAAAALFVAGFLLLIAAACNAGMFKTDPAEHVADARSMNAQVDIQLHAVKRLIDSTVQLDVLDWVLAIHSVDVILLALLVVLFVFGRRIDINAFSMHNLYKNRLVRCYLGASNPARDAQPFMGLAEHDDVPLQQLAGQRPFHIVNATLNIAQGADLAWQERKAASFVFTPLHCGYALATTRGDSTARSSGAGDGPLVSAYRPTSAYAMEDGEDGDGEHRHGITLGVALATSGAAVSPNMGNATRPMRAFALTVFNLRLGRWCSNPARSAWKRSGPRFGLVSLLQELTGNSNERTRYVYVSDGGHFDNLGLYELVRRRCAVIVAVDAAADDERALGDLADSIRKCRIDFGVEIALPKIDGLVGDDGQRSDRGYAVGTIDYGDFKGTLILLKPSLVNAGDEPLDVLHYARQNAEFPQQSTADQFYGEAQFESYRRLGLHIGEQCLDQVEGLLRTHVLEPDIDAPERGPEPAKAPVLGAAGVPSLATRVVGVLMRRRGEHPPQNGSQIDAVVFAAVAALILLLSILLGDAGVAILEWLRPAAAGTPVWLPVRVQLDNALVLAYLSMFVAGFSAAFGPRKPGQDVAVRAELAKVVLCGLAVATAAVDLQENFVLLAPPAAAAAIDIERISQIKWMLFGMTSLAFVACSKQIRDVFRERWRRV